MAKGYRLGLAVLLTISLMLSPLVVLAETSASQSVEPEVTPRIINSLEGLMDYFAECEKAYGRAFAVQEAESVLNRFPDEYYYNLAVLSYFDPRVETELILAAGERIIRRRNIPAYPDGADQDFMSCASAYGQCLTAYYNLGNEKELLRCADWLMSYVGVDDSCFGSAIAACGTLVGYYDEQGDEEKTVYYAKRLESMLNTYGKQYPHREEVIKTVYQMCVAPYVKDAATTNP